ncbi:hypothetical protein [Bradyrhizobium sp. USDA 10063]
MTSLRLRMVEDMQVRNLSHHTRDSYLLQVSQFARHFAKPPALSVLLTIEPGDMVFSLDHAASALRIVVGRMP